MRAACVLRSLACVAAAALALILLVYAGVVPCPPPPAAVMVPRERVGHMRDSRQREYTYSRDMPIIFVGGVPRSGTTLMRVLLDAHPDIRCGEETRIIPRILGMRTQWYKSQKEATRLEEAGLTASVVDDAIAAFILEVIAKHGEAAPRLCNKDPFMLKSAGYLAQMFPGSRFVLMVRDGRAVVHSIITRKVTITGFDLHSYRQSLSRWNQAMQAMWEQCRSVGATRCLPVWYEQLVLHPETKLRQILSFLEVPWNETVLHHEEQVGKPGGISLSKTERSTDQVIKPVNIEALTKWVGAIPEDVVRDMAAIAPMLKTLGYDPAANPPDYGKPDKIVAEKQKEIEANRHLWLAREAEIRAANPNNANKDAR